MTTHDEPKLSSQDNVTNFDITSQLTKLWELSDNGKAEWWPDTVWLRKNNQPYYSHDEGYEDSPMEIDDALHIVKGHAEDWLRGRGWFKFANEQGESWSHKKVNRAMALPDAILAEAGRVCK